MDDEPYIEFFDDATKSIAPYGLVSPSAHPVARLAGAYFFVSRTAIHPVAVRKTPLPLVAVPSPPTTEAVIFGIPAFI